MPNPAPGTILGAYRVEGTIGAGSMGDVFKAIDTGLNRRVAIKILSEKHRDSPELRARFVREGRAVAAISHPNVVQVFATGTFDERPYIAMELLDGTDLGSVVEKDGPLDSTTAAHAVLDAAQGLAAAAKAGLIHRDVKPSNLVRLSSGVVKVTDFGLAKPVDPGTEPALTAMGVVVGTPDYIAPEQARGETIDERVDIYALGGTLYFLLTGIPPFRTGKPAEDKYLKVVARHLRNPPPDATHAEPARRQGPRRAGALMMAKKPRERPGVRRPRRRGSPRSSSRLDPGAVPELLVASRDRSRPNLAIPPSRPSAPSLDDSATVGDLAAAGAARLPGWLIAFTVLCVAVFVAGLVVYLKTSGPSTPTAPAKPDAAAVAPIDAPPPIDAAKPKPDAPPPIDAAEVDPQPPAGMLAVKKSDGGRGSSSTRCRSGSATSQQFASKHTQAGKPEDAVVSVGYDEARAYAAVARRPPAHAATSGTTPR